MKKRMWLLLLVMMLAALDVIAVDYLRINAAASKTSDSADVDRSATGDQNGRRENSGIPPAEVASIIREELLLFPIPQSITHTAYQAAYED